MGVQEVTSELQTTTNMIEHDCPVEGSMLVTEGQPCSWCFELDDEQETGGHT